MWQAERWGGAQQGCPGATGLSKATCQSLAAASARGRVHSRNMHKVSPPRDRKFRPHIAVRQGIWMTVSLMCHFSAMSGQQTWRVEKQGWSNRPFDRMIPCPRIFCHSRPAGTTWRKPRANSPSCSLTQRSSAAVSASRAETTVRRTSLMGCGPEHAIGQSRTNTHRPATTPPMSAWPGCARPPDR